MSEMGDAERVATNGIELVVHSAGEPRRPAVVLLHGFPELAYSWRHQVPAFSAAGYHVLAPDLRGYGASDAPDDVEAYSMRTLVADVTGVLDHYRCEQAAVIGHDFGGMLAWHCAVYAPQRVAAVASLGTPHGPRGRTNVAESYRRRFGPSHYMTTFQEPGVGEAILEADIEHTFDAMLRGVQTTLAEFRTMPPEVQALPVGLFLGEPPLFGAPLVDAGERAVYVDAYRASGFRGPLSWYRGLARTWEEAEGVDMRIDHRGVLIQGADDFFLARDQGDLTDQYVPNLERHVVPRCGHWIQQEQPAIVNQILLHWLSQTP